MFWKSSKTRADGSSVSWETSPMGLLSLRASSLKSRRQRFQNHGRQGGERTASLNSRRKLGAKLAFGRNTTTRIRRPFGYLRKKGERSSALKHDKIRFRVADAAGFHQRSGIGGERSFLAFYFFRRGCGGWRSEEP